MYIIMLCMDIGDDRLVPDVLYLYTAFLISILQASLYNNLSNILMVIITTCIAIVADKLLHIGIYNCIYVRS